MNRNVASVSEKLFGANGIGATNIKVTLGSRRDVTADEIAREIGRALTQIESGDFEVVDIAAID